MSNSRKPPARRDSKYVLQQHERALQAMVPGTLGGRLANASPIFSAGGSTVEAEGDGGGLVVTDVDSASWQDDYFVLTADGPQVLPLTYLPIPNSEDVKCWGDGQKRGTDWDRALGSQDLSILTPMDARIDDEISVHYQWLTGLPATPEDPLPLNIPFEADGWSYIGVTLFSQVATYTNPATDFSAWSVGAAPLGWPAWTDALGHPLATTLPPVHNELLGHERDAVIRRTMPPGTDITVTVHGHNYITVYVNGSSVATTSTGTNFNFATAIADQAANWDLSIYLNLGNGSTTGGVDIEVTGTDS